MAFIHSCWTDSNNHSPALFKINTGISRMGFPCVGVVGDLRPRQREPEPAGVRASCTTRSAAACPKGHAQNWGAGFLPSIFQGTALKPQGAPIDNLSRPPEMTDAAAAGPARPAGQAQPPPAGAARPAETDLAARIESFELAYRMQMAAPEALDVGTETPRRQKLYGLDDPKCAHFAPAVPDRPAAGRARRPLLPVVHLGGARQVINRLALGLERRALIRCSAGSRRPSSVSGPSGCPRPRVSYMTTNDGKFWLSEPRP